MRTEDLPDPMSTMAPVYKTRCRRPCTPEREMQAILHPRERETERERCRRPCRLERDREREIKRERGREMAMGPWSKFVKMEMGYQIWSHRLHAGWATAGLRYGTLLVRTLSLQALTHLHGQHRPKGQSPANTCMHGVGNEPTG